MSKNLIAILISILILIGSVAYDFAAQKSYYNSLNSINKEIDEIKYIKNLKRVWSPKSIKKRIQKALSSVNSSNKKIFIKRKKATITLKSLDEKKLNSALGKLASLPLNFTQLQVTKSGNKFQLECKCDW